MRLGPCVDFDSDLCSSFSSVNLFVNPGRSVLNVKAGSPVSDDLLNRGIDAQYTIKSSSIAAVPPPYLMHPKP